MNEGINSSSVAAMATAPTFPTTHNHPNTTQARPTVLLPHKDSGPLCLNDDGISTFYSTIPPGLGRVYMLHPLRYLQPAGDFYFIQHSETRYPQIKSGLYCCHCFTLHPRGQSCPQPCSNPCGVCNGIHPPGLFCNLCYNTLSSWARKGININEHIAPPTGTFQPTKPQFAVLQANGYIDPTQIYNAQKVPRFTSQAPLDGRQSTPHPFIFSGPPPPPRQTQTAPMTRRYPPQQQQQHEFGGYNGFGGSGYDNMADWHDYTGNMAHPQPFVQNGQSSFNPWQGLHTPYMQPSLSVPNPWQGPQNPYMQPTLPAPNSWYGSQSPYMQGPQSSPYSWYGQPNTSVQAAQPMDPRLVQPSSSLMDAPLVPLSPMAPPTARTHASAPSNVAPSQSVSPTESVASQASALPQINITCISDAPQSAGTSRNTPKPNNGFARSRRRHGGKNEGGSGKGNYQHSHFAGVQKPRSDKSEVLRRINRDSLRGGAPTADVNETLAAQDQEPTRYRLEQSDNATHQLQVQQPQVQQPEVQQPQIHQEQATAQSSEKTSISNHEASKKPRYSFPVYWLPNG